jgi:hypothetical protein
MSSNFGQLTRDLVGKRLLLRGRTVIDNKFNVKAANVNAKNIHSSGTMFACNLSEKVSGDGIQLFGDLILDENSTLQATTSGNVITSNISGGGNPVCVTDELRLKDCLVFDNKGTVVSGAFSESETTATLDACVGTVTTPSSTQAMNTAFDIILTNTNVTATSIVQAIVTGYSGSNGIPIVQSTSVGAGTVTIKVYNVGTASLDGTVSVGFTVF